MVNSFATPPLVSPCGGRLDAASRERLFSLRSLSRFFGADRFVGAALLGTLRLCSGPAPDVSIPTWGVPDLCTIFILEPAGSWDSGTGLSCFAALAVEKRIQFIQKEKEGEEDSPGTGYGRALSPTLQSFGLASFEGALVGRKIKTSTVMDSRG